MFTETKFNRAAMTNKLKSDKWLIITLENIRNQYENLDYVVKINDNTIKTSIKKKS